MMTLGSLLNFRCLVFLKNEWEWIFLHFLILSPFPHCVTQLKLYTGYKLSSPIFCCLWVIVSGIGNTRPNLHFFQYIQAYKPFADHVPPNIKQYQLILTKYQPVSSYTDPVPSSTTYNSSSRKAQFSQLNNLSFYDSFDESRTVYLVWLTIIFILVNVNDPSHQ